MVLAMIPSINFAKPVGLKSSTNNTLVPLLDGSKVYVPIGRAGPATTWNSIN